MPQKSGAGVPACVFLVGMNKGCRRDACATFRMQAGTPALLREDAGVDALVDERLTLSPRTNPLCVYPLSAMNFSHKSRRMRTCKLIPGRRAQDSTK